jgi:hypothetical protein
MRIVRLALAVSLALPVAGSAQAAKPATTDTAAVRAVVGRYLHGLKFNDVAALKEAFWPQAKLYWVKGDGTQGELSQDDWYKGFAANAGKEEKGDLKISAMDVTGDIASVKVVETYPGSVYIDYLNLLKVGGKWRIVNKVYTSRKP